MATVLENYYGIRRELEQRMAQQPGKVSNLWCYGEVLYRIEVVSLEIPVLLGHYQMLDAYVQCLARERRYGPNRGSDTQKEREAAQNNLERVIQDYRKRFSGFHPASPEAYRKEIGRVVTTFLPAWLQYRNTFVFVKQLMKEGES